MCPSTSNGMRRRGEIVLVTSGDPRRLTGGHLYNRRMLAALHAHGRPVRQIVIPDCPLFPTIVWLRFALMRQRPLLVIVDSISVGTVAPLVGWMRRRLGARVIALMHMLPSDLARAWRRPLLRHAERRVLGAADRVVAVSPYLRERLVAAGAAADCTVVIPPGRDSLRMSSARRNLRDNVRFLCVANWSPSKGIHTVVEAMARMPRPVELELVGDEVDRSYARRIYGLIRRERLDGRVRVLGRLNGPQLAERYADADVFVLPSTSEGFGTVYAEAMSFGLPVIACRVGPLPWLLEAGRCGILVPPNDCVAVAEAMEALACDSTVRRRLGDAAYRRALDLPTWQESGEEFCSVVRDEFDTWSRARVTGRPVYPMGVTGV
jgi:glycosyltransferase involved in cell wall biosynthesis